MAATTKPPLGRYRGVSGEERLEQRRVRLLQAGLERFGVHGFACSSVKSVCVEAGLHERYFYAIFEDREDLLAAVYELIVAELLAATIIAVTDAPRDATARAQAGLGAFFEVLTSDLRKARVLLLEVVGVSKRLEQRRRHAMHEMAAFIEQAGVELIGANTPLAVEPRLTALTLVGGINALLIEWLLNEQRTDPSALIEHCSQTFVTLYNALAV